MQGALDAGAVVGVELADALHHMVQLGVRDLFVDQHHLALDVTRRGHTAQVEDDLKQVVVIVGLMHGRDNLLGQDAEQGVEVVCDLQLGHT